MYYKKEPHLCHIHLQTIPDIQINTIFYYFYGKQEGDVDAPLNSPKLQLVDMDHHPINENDWVSEL